MGSKNLLNIAAYDEIMHLRKSISILNVEILISSDPSYKNQLRMKVEDLKERIGALLLGCGENMRGYAIYLSLPWKTHGEQKYDGMSWALIKMKNYDEARKTLKKGIKRFPESSTLIVTKGILQLVTHHYTGAVQSFEHAFDLDPCNLDALYYKAFSLNLLGLYEEAVPILQYLTEECPDDHCSLVEMGHSYFMTGYIEDACKYYRKAQETGRKSGNMYCGLYCTYRYLGFQDEALHIAQEGLKEYPDEPAMYDNLGECYYERGWIADAKEILKEGIRKFPEDYGLRETLRKIEEETDPDNGKKPPIGLIILLIMLLSRLKEKHMGREH